MEISKLKLILFDVSGTLFVKDGFIYEPRTETIIGTLQNLKSRGIELHFVSDTYTTDDLVRIGFPEDLFTPYTSYSSKQVKIKEVLEKTGVKPEEALFFGDDSLDDGEAAKQNKVLFILVDSEGGPDLEDALIGIFGPEIKGKSPKKAESKEEEFPKRSPTEKIRTNPEEEVIVLSDKNGISPDRVRNILHSLSGQGNLPRPHILDLPKPRKKKKPGLVRRVLRKLRTR